MEPKDLIIKARIDICERCPIFNKKLRNCQLSKGGCGCFIDVGVSPFRYGKAYMMGQGCPHKKWLPMNEDDIIRVLNLIDEDE